MKANIHNMDNHKMKSLIRYERLLRNGRIWTVLRFIVSIKDIEECTSFYDLDKAIDNYNDAYNRLSQVDYSPTTDDISVALRYCLIKHHQGSCSRTITNSEKESIFNWSNYHMDYEPILEQVTVSFQQYWDEVISEYKRVASKKNRIDYLVEHLNDMRKKKNIMQLPKIHERLNTLILHYTTLRANL